MSKLPIDKPVAYLAGPEVFLPNAIEIGQQKIAICRDHGFDAVFPFEPLESASTTTPAESGHAIFMQCVAMMERCNLAIANMTPFRGASMDVGTAVEIGYMYGRGYPILGYTNVVEDYKDRVPADAMNVESFGFADNLMCEEVIRKSGGSVVRTRVDVSERYTDLRGFVACVEQAATLIGARAPADPTMST